MTGFKSMVWPLNCEHLVKDATIHIEYSPFGIIILVFIYFDLLFYLLFIFLAYN